MSIRHSHKMYMQYTSLSYLWRTTLLLWNITVLQLLLIQTNVWCGYDLSAELTKNQSQKYSNDCFRHRTMQTWLLNRCVKCIEINDINCLVWKIQQMMGYIKLHNEVFLQRKLCRCRHCCAWCSIWSQGWQVSTIHNFWKMNPMITICSTDRVSPLS